MSQRIRCAIVEDEPLAQELLAKFIRRVPSLDLLITFDDAVEAFDQLPQLQPDLLFLDINMPEMSGLELLRAYPPPLPLTVLTTAYPNYALDGFDLGVVDYLLKPIPFDRFVKAVNRVRERMVVSAPIDDTTRSVGNDPAQAAPVEFIYLKTDKKLEQVAFEQIVFIEGMGDYLKVFLSDRLLITHLTMTRMEESLPTNQFLRINRSYIVQLKHVTRLEGNTITTSTGQNITVGPNYRDRVREWLQQRLLS